MTVRRFLVATAVAVLACAFASAAWAAGSGVRDGGATTPATAAPSGVSAGKTELLTAIAAHKAAVTHGTKKLTGEFSSENTPLVTGTSKAKNVSAGGAGTSLLRTIVGLLLVVGAIYGVAWVMRRVKRSREEQATGRGLASMATLPLGAGRALHLVRAGSDVILVGTSEHGVAPIQRYTEEEALANGVLDDGQREAVMHEAAGAFLPDGSPQPPIAAGWRNLQGGGSGPQGLIEALRRLTVRS